MFDLLTLARQASASAVERLRGEFLDDAGVENVEGKDIKTQADVAAQECIIDVLAESGLPIYAEESGGELPDLEAPVWLVDPLDGTMNFSRGFPLAAVSIALWENGAPLLGVVHDVFHGQVYAAEVATGNCWLNDQKTCVSGVTELSQAILATGFPSGRSYDTASLLRFVEKVKTYKKVRMLGSAALMLAQVSAGRFDAYEEEDIYLWDVAAGLALVKAAGGEFSLRQGSGTGKYRVRASNGLL